MTAKPDFMAWQGAFRLFPRVWCIKAGRKFFVHTAADPALQRSKQSKLFKYKIALNNLCKIADGNFLCTPCCLCLASHILRQLCRNLNAILGTVWRWHFLLLFWLVCVAFSSSILSEKVGVGCCYENRPLAYCTSDLSHIAPQTSRILHLRPLAYCTSDLSHIAPQTPRMLHLRPLAYCTSDPSHIAPQTPRMLHLRPLACCTSALLAALPANTIISLIQEWPATGMVSPGEGCSDTPRDDIN